VEANLKRLRHCKAESERSERFKFMVTIGKIGEYCQRKLLLDKKGGVNDWRFSETEVTEYDQLESKSKIRRYTKCQAL